MIFLSMQFYSVVIALLLIYYIVPPRIRWTILLVGSLGIYYYISGKGILLLGIGIFVSYCTGLFLKKLQEKQCPQKYEKLCLAVGIIIVAAPLFVLKEGNFIRNHLLHRDSVIFWPVLGIAYYTLQMIGYMVDVYRREITAEVNPAKYALFVSFFPQIVQGPIARYGQLGCQFYGGLRFDEKKFSKGLQWILWGFFLKMLIADRAGVIVDTVFDNWEIYKGCYVLAAGVLYSIQLYTDFMACVYIAKGIAALFGIELVDNFRNPYFSNSVKEFWGRWHISLSSWLRDYLYIPLGGNRKGKIRKWINIGIVFAVSGMWHGGGYKYVIWGLMHAFYQIMGEITAKGRAKLYKLVKMDEGEFAAGVIKKVLTFFWVMLAWIIFRADSLRAGVNMLRSLFTVYNPWVFFNDSLFALGLDIKECMLLLLAILFLFAVGYKQRRMKMELGEWLLRQHVIARWVVYICAVLLIVVFGMYGYGFDAKDFIYGGF